MAAAQESAVNLVIDVVGPAGRRPVLAPADAPVADLLPELVRLVGEGPAEDDGWALAPPVGRPLDPDASLRAGGVRRGSVLYLVRSGLAEDADGILPPRALVGMRTPLDRTEARLPRQLGRWNRLKAAVALARVDDGADPRDAPAAALHPGYFTEARHAPFWKRAGRAWRKLDYVGRLEAEIVAPRLARCVTVAVTSPCPGTGKTVVAILLATLLAELRRDGVVVLDAAPGPGSFATLVTSGRGLRVATEPPERPVLERLRRRAGLILVDCAASLDVRQIDGVDQVLAVADATPEAMAGLGPAVRSAQEAGCRSVLAVANAARRAMTAADVRRLAVCAPEADGLVAIQWSPAGAAGLAAGGGLDREPAPGDWGRSTRELAAAVVADWLRLGLAG